MNSKLVSSKFQQDQKQSKDKELGAEINTNCLRSTFLSLQARTELGSKFWGEGAKPL